MFAHDWPDEINNDDHLPYEERGWVKRLRARTAARERFDREHPTFFEDVGRAMATQMQEEALKILLGEDQ